MSTFNPGTYQSGDGNLNEPITVGRLGQPVKLGGGTAWQSIASGPFSTRPSAESFGSGEWTDSNGKKYYSNGVTWGESAVLFPTPKWDAARVKAATGLGNAKALFIGDSTTAGLYANGNQFAGNGMLGWTRRLKALVTSQEIANASWIGSSHTTTTAEFNSYDSRITFGANWTILQTSSDVLGGFPIYDAATTGLGGAANTVSFNSGETFDTIDVYYISTPGGGQFTVDIGGAVLDTINTLNAVLGITKATVSCTLGANTVNIIKTVTGAVEITGVSCYKNNNAIQLLNAGDGGYSLSQMFNGVGFGPENGITAIDPDLTIISHGINDQALSKSLAEFKPKYQAVIDHCLQYGDVALAIPSPYVAADTNLAYRNIIRELAAENGLNLFDFTEALGGSYAVANANGIMSIGAHPTSAGYRLISDYVLKTGLFV
jgi:lysophospholipase L1-like esterase